MTTLVRVKSVSFDTITVHLFTISTGEHTAFPPPPPPVTSTTEVVGIHSTILNIIVLCVGQNSQQFLVLSVWAPADQVEVFTQEL